MPKKIALIGGPATGKTTLINALKTQGYYCMDEISRQVTLDAQKNGIEQLFLKDPIWFSKQLLESRKKQFIEAQNSNEPVVFFDRGLPDIVAYLDYIKSDYGQEFITFCEVYKYDKIFILPPWKAIYRTDNERYESFDQLLEIHGFLKKWYSKFGYEIIEVHIGSTEERLKFILNRI
ncbi:MAG: ATP-binding protein [Bacteroidetes bacterium]|nr:ATP-binding protein [Bacteroidota bacterium]MDA0859404.1 ATP-binding protein [Bacteroidota bacterium]MDA1318009.1 ATP-binding protein [Bacteroidota bacterium]